MKTVVICLVVMFLAFAIDAYVQNPTGSLKVVNDLHALAVSLLPKSVAARLENPAEENASPAASPSATLSQQAVAASSGAIPPSPPAEAALPPLPVWTPPAVMPAQPNWTWTALDGKTYQNVVVTKIEPDLVSITHALGVARLSIATLPPDIQKQLNYDPKAAAAARDEAKREEDHPFYVFSERAAAAAKARQLGRPLAWIDGFLGDLQKQPGINPEADATQLAVQDLKSQAVTIFCDGNTDLYNLPSAVRDQLFILDDGPMPGGHHFYSPKIVFSNPDVTQIYGRVPYTQMKASGVAAIDAVLVSIPKDGSAAVPPAPAVAPQPAPSPAVTAPSPPPATNSPPAPTADATSVWAPPDVMPAQPNWTWTTSDGKSYQNVVVTQIGADTATITHSLGVAHVSIALLPPDIQKQLDYDPRAASQIPALVDGKLVSTDGTAAVTPGSNVKYYAIYYSAQWCPPCHKFTPVLVQWYNQFKPTHPGFELIFVSEDHSETDMFNYMKEMAMPWPAVRFTELSHPRDFMGSNIEKFAHDGIPDLVLVDAGGKVLSDSWRDGTYVGPEAVVDDINKLVAAGP